MKHGDPVEVLIVWAYSSPSPLERWFSGYTFERVEESGNVLVKADEGVCSGVTLRYAPSRVRLKKEDAPCP